MENIFFSENQFDGKTIEKILTKFQNLPNLECIDFTHPQHEFRELNEKKAMKFHILRPIQAENGKYFPSLRQLRFFGDGYQLNSKIKEDPEHENIEKTISTGIKSFKEKCSIEF